MLILRYQFWGINSVMTGCPLLGFSATLRNPEFRHHLQKRSSESNNPSRRLPLPFMAKGSQFLRNQEKYARPLSAHRHCLFNVLTTNLHLYTSLPPPEPPDMPFRITRFTVNMGIFGNCWNKEHSLRMSRKYDYLTLLLLTLTGILAPCFVRCHL